MKRKKILFVIITVAIITIVMIMTSYAAYVINATEISCENGSLKEALDNLYNIAKTKATKRWSAGDTVTFGGESFQVLNDVFEGQREVELFCKTNLNTNATSQANAAYSSTKCGFSSKCYWSKIWQSGSFLNLNLEWSESENDAIGKARKYAYSKNALNGRLLTYNEANTMKDSSNTAVVNMLKGTGNTVQNYELYWISSPKETGSYNMVYYVKGRYKEIATNDFYSGSDIGVRPIITVLVSQIS